MLENTFPLAVALQTARAGSKSVPSKNLLPARGKPLYLHNLLYALQTPEIAAVYCSTDIPAILNAADRHGFHTIHRPAHLTTDTASHHATILHGLHTIEQELEKTVDILVVLLGNNYGAHPEDLSKGLQKIAREPDTSAVMSAGTFNMYNPFRAYRLDQYKHLRPAIRQTAMYHQECKSPGMNDKDAFGDIFFFNGSFWIIRRKALLAANGDGPFPWLGNNVRVIVQEPTIQELDAPWQLPLFQGVHYGHVGHMGPSGPEESHA